MTLRLIGLLRLVIIGHQKQWQFLTKAAQSGKIPHGLLFYGEEKLGKKTLALQWISEVFGKDILKQQHPDFMLLAPEKKEIQISQIRELNWKLSLKPFEAPFKAAIIDQAHLMNQEAQNCFLKTLEEPRGETILVLVTEYPERLFSTILSRVQRVKFYPVAKEEIKKYLISQGMAEKESDKIAEISLGRPGMAIEFLSNPEKLKTRKEKIQQLNKILTSNLASRFQYAKDLSSSPQDLRETLNLWLEYFRNILLSKTKNLAPYQYQNYSFSKLKKILHRIQSTNFLISTTNVNPRLALEILMLEL